jgi:tRNA-specific 2-thiouridylase
MKIVVAMSGGVDSSVAVALLKEEGHEVIGVTMKLSLDPAGYDPASGRDAIKDAREIADKLGIEHHVLDFRDIFARLIIDDFCREYGLGRTPNPCVRCNRLIKFGALWEKAQELGAVKMATGHYARVEPSGPGRYLLKKGVDPRKDQSYFLYALTQEHLCHVVFPVGHLTKDRVRQTAKELGLPVSRRESQEICFVPDDDHVAFMNKYLAKVPVPGPIIDREGKVLGRHSGIASYTIGQRHGLGVAAPEPLYVTAIKPDRNAIVVGTKEQTCGRELVATGLNWISEVRPESPIEVKARIRYRHPEADALATPLPDGDVKVEFAEPQMAITPGQSVVFYRGDDVVGGGIITKAGN